jgi:3-hydroxybutyryl-CoA dehydrogenase
MKVIGILGTGTMARGISLLIATSGHDVLVLGRSSKSLDAFNSYVAKWFHRRLEKGKISQDMHDASINRINTTRQLDSLFGVDLIIEAVVEDLEVKRDLLGAADQVCPPKTIIASNTSSLPINEIASKTQHSNRVIGMHFMNPPHVMPLVEIVPSKSTSEETLNKAVTFAKSLGKEPLIVPDIPGFVLNRLLFVLLHEAMDLVETGVVDVATVDEALRNGANHPMGPFELADFIGLDVCLSIFEVLYRELQDAKYDPPRLLKEKVSAGKLGRKSGEGFYKYRS